MCLSVLVLALVVVLQLLVGRREITLAELRPLLAALVARRVVQRLSLVGLVRAG